ncbi:MAG: Holliday junction branch migration DNA helicase RuvB [Kiritimatiellae bacterium]|nr:Holliday junction branch migration DNA helicase RuvB [Kiritimatiellia bacterium]MDD4341158.1 Holliday junction branch migration DNA helicase RuvB [Kiritimatiellia bacterium]
MAEHPPAETRNCADEEFELTLRPSRFVDFVGQAKIRERLELSVAAAAERDESLDHVLLCGPPGLGKTTLAYILGAAMNATVKATSGPVLAKPADLAGMLTNLEKGDILFIDEIHRIQKSVEEYLYSAMEDYVIDIVLDQGVNARSVRLNLPRFTLVGATTRSGLLSAPMRSRFGTAHRLDYYSTPELAEVVTRSARILNVDMAPEGALEIAARSRGTPRIANNLLRWVRDYAQIRANNHIDREVADQALTMLDVDSHGLDEMDKRILRTIVEKYAGGPVGLNTIAVSVGEESGTLEEVYEPFLIQQGLLARTPQGRTATPAAFRLLGLTPRGTQPELS